MFFKLLKIAVFIGLIFLVCKISIKMIFKLLKKSLSNKSLMIYSLISSGAIITYVLMSNKKEGFENDEEEESEIETEGEIITPEESIEEEVEEEQEIQVEEGTPTEQEEDLKKDIQGNLQVLLNDMVNKTAEQEETLSRDEPKPSTNTSQVRTELTQEPQAINDDLKIAENQDDVEDSGFAKAMLSVVDEEPRPLPELSDFGGNIYTIKPVEEWLKPNLAEEAVKPGCQCPVYSAFSGANWATV